MQILNELLKCCKKHSGWDQINQAMQNLLAENNKMFATSELIL